MEGIAALRLFFLFKSRLIFSSICIAAGGINLRLLKGIGLTLLLLFALLILLPAVIVRGCNRGFKSPEVDVDPCRLAVWNHKTEKLEQMSLGEYLLGVVAAEMPAEFHLEALKAQAIVARTYTIAKLRAYGGAGCAKHPQADICTDSTHCQAWTGKEEARAKWPFFRQNAYWHKILKAVSETQGQVVTYKGKLIDAVYHSTCGGSTENSEDVWSNEFPYLRAVPCEYCAHSPRLTETLRMNEMEVAAKLGEDIASLKLEVTARSASGRIIQVDAGTQVYRGLDFRTRLGLRSSKVTWLREKGVLTFTTIGYGHGVGLCQYGADGMAAQGFNVREILSYYYTGVQVLRVRLEE